MSAARTLSRDQVGHLVAAANEPEGGFSVRAYDPGLGDEARGGYVTALPTHARDFPTATTQHGMDYIRDKRAELLPEDRFFGGFRGETPPRTAFDVSEKRPTTFTGHLGTATVAMSGNQEAYGHISESGMYTNIDNPYYEEGQGHALRNVSPDQMSWAIQASHVAHPNEGIDDPVPSRSAKLTGPSRWA